MIITETFDRILEAVFGPRMICTCEGVPPEEVVYTVGVFNNQEAFEVAAGFARGLGLKVEDRGPGQNRPIGAKRVRVASGPIELEGLDPFFQERLGGERPMSEASQTGDVLFCGGGTLGHGQHCLRVKGLPNERAAEQLKEEVLPRVLGKQGVSNHRPFGNVLQDVATAVGQELGFLPV